MTAGRCEALGRAPEVQLGGHGHETLQLAHSTGIPYDGFIAIGDESVLRSGLYPLDRSGHGQSRGQPGARAIGKPVPEPVRHVVRRHRARRGVGHDGRLRPRTAAAADALPRATLAWLGVLLGYLAHAIPARAIVTDLTVSAAAPFAFSRGHRADGARR